MTDKQTVTQGLQEQVLEGVRKSQDSIVEAVQAWADSVKRLTPQLPTAKLGEELPQPVELIDKAFDFAGQLLAAQRQFAHEVLKAATPGAEQAEKTAK
jgi:hypothetical protein